MNDHLNSQSRRPAPQVNADSRSEPAATAPHTRLASQLEQKLVGLYAQQITTGSISAVAAMGVVILIAPKLENPGWLQLIAVLRLMLVTGRLIFVRRVEQQLAQGTLKDGTITMLAMSAASSVFLSGALTWPLVDHHGIDLAAFLIVIISLVSICLEAVQTGYHRRVLALAMVAGVLGLGSKIAVLTPEVGPLMPVGLMIFMGAIQRYAKVVGHQARGGIVINLRSKQLSQRLERTNRALERALDQAKWLANRDSLTELPNRRAFADNFGHFAAQYRHRKLVLMLLDIDHFKRINDRFGHAMGDGVLVAIGKTLDQWHSDDTGRAIGRWGGEEFIAVVALRPGELPDQHAEDLRQRIAALGQELHWPDHLQLSTSIGCAQLDDANGFDAAMSRADEALYLAKHSGRNCSRLAA